MSRDQLRVAWNDMAALAATAPGVAPAPDPRPPLEPSPGLLRACAATKDRCVRCHVGFVGPLGLCHFCLGIRVRVVAVGPLPKKEVYPRFCSCGTPTYCKGLCKRCYQRAWSAS